MRRPIFPHSRRATERLYHDPISPPTRDGHILTSFRNELSYVRHFFPVTTAMDFAHKLTHVQQHNNSWIGLRLDIRHDQLPLPLLSSDEPLRPFAQALIDATRDLVCAYILDPAYFFAEGAAGAIALERIVRYIPETVPVILDTRFGTLTTSAPAYARAAFEAFNADACTFSHVPDRGEQQAFLAYTGKAIFVPLLGLLTLHPNMAGNGLIVEAKELSHLQLSAISTPLLITQWTPAEEAAAAKVIGTNGINPIIDLGAALIYTSRGADFAEVASATVRKARARINAYRPTALAAL